MESFEQDRAKAQIFCIFRRTALISSEQVMNMQVFIVELCTDWGVFGRCLPIAVGYNESQVKFYWVEYFILQMWNIGTFVFLICTLDLSEFNANVMTGNNEAYQRSPYDPGIQK